jgi:hypothetical protein
MIAGEAIYDQVTQVAAAAAILGKSRHTKLLETGATQTKQTTALPISRHKIRTLPDAINVETRATQTKQITATVSNRGKIEPLPDANHRFLIDSPKRLKIAVSRTKQTTEAVSNRMKIRGCGDSRILPPDAGRGT